MSVLTKYRHVYLTGIQNGLVYRWNFLIRGFFSLIHLMVVFTLWGAAFAGVEHIGGFSVRETMTYFVTLLVLQFFIGAFNEDYQVSEEIRNGMINQFLLKPINYYLYRFSVFLSARTVSGLLILIPMAVAFPFLKDHLTLPDGLWRLWLGLPALLMAGIIQFSIAYCFGLMAFWFLEIQGLVILSYALETLLSGTMFPLDLMPAGLFQISQHLPFYYMMYFPAAIVSGRIASPDQVYAGLGIQAFWCVVFIVLARLLWNLGLRKHTAVGG